MTTTKELDKNCIFCKINQKEVPAEIIYEDNEILAFNDKHPLAPVHVLIIPKKHIPTVDDLAKKDEGLAGKMILAAKNIARKLKISDNGYKLLIRVKHHGGQEVDHVHLHLLGGAPLAEDIRPI